MKRLFKLTLNIICAVIIVAGLTGCAITQEDVQFTWDAMKAHYGDVRTEMPKIEIQDKKMYLSDETRVLGLYIPVMHMVVLYDGWDYRTIVHEFHHALGNKLNERNYTYAEFRAENTNR